MADTPDIEITLLTVREPGKRPYPQASWPERLELLRQAVRSLDRVVVAYSGGVDSSLVLAVAHEQLGERALGVIGVSDSYARHELELATAQARGIGARLTTVATGELSNPDFARNPKERCYHCKTALYDKLAQIAHREGATILDGTIADDLSDWRPGHRAAREHAVQSPLAELGFRKADVRAAADAFGLTSAGKPASPCLASRIPYGTPIDKANLSQVERAEALLRSLGFHELRVRHHGDTARIEVALERLAEVAASEVRVQVVEGLRAIGFRKVVLDLAGLRTDGANN